ncbi:MAG: calcium/sodium antiporter [Candidatus Nanoarchaeia archaeon]
MLIQILLLVIGILGLWFSAEIVIRSAQVVAHKLKISETFIGLTILSIGTTLPELGTHIISSIRILHGQNLSDLAVSMNVGSNLIQITAILGIVALFMKVKSDKKFLDGDYIVMLLSIFLLFVLGYNGIITRLEGAFLMICYLLYIWSLGRAEHFVEKIENNIGRKKLTLYFIGIPAGILLLLISSELTVMNAHFLAGKWGVADTFIGALVLGLGTALPELAAAIVAIRRKSEEMSIGVLVGSNITNPLFGIGLGAVISTYTISDTILWLDIPAWFFVSIVVLLFFWRKLQLERKEAIMMIACYVAYVALKFKFMA